MMSYLYAAIIFLLSPFVALLQLKTMRGRFRLSERFGMWGIKQKTSVMWFHGASLGEIKGLSVIINEYKKHFPDEKILVTVTSTTAIPEACKMGSIIKVLPFDCLLFYWIALRNISVKKLVITETECWPGLLSFSAARHTDIIWINARISDKTSRGLLLYKRIFGLDLRSVKNIFITDPAYRKRFESLGTEPTAILEAPNTKYAHVPISKEKATATVKGSIPGSTVTVTIGNVRLGEQSILFPFALECARSGALVFIVPRHPEDFESLKDELHRELSTFQIQHAVSIPFIRSFSEYQSKNPPCGIVYVDTFGVLESLYALSTIVVSAGSFKADYKGHNILEAAPYGPLLITGPYNLSSESLFTELKTQSALLVASGTDELNGLFKGFLNDASSFQAHRHRYIECWKRYQQFPTRLLAAIEGGENTR